MSDIDRAELRRLLDEAETPWTIEQATPNMDGPNWRIRRECKAGIIISAHEYGFHGRGELIAAAVNVLPDLLDALEKAEGHRDSLAATLIEVQREKRAAAADLLPAESIALTVALAQLLRGDEPDPNVASMCILALARIAGRHDWTAGGGVR